MGGLTSWVGGSDWVGGWGSGWVDGGSGQVGGGAWPGGWVGLTRWVWGSSQMGGGSGWVGGGRLHSKVWTDAYMNATGF